MLSGQGCRHAAAPTLSRVVRAACRAGPEGPDAGAGSDCECRWLCVFLEGIRGDAVLHAACLFRGNFRIHPGVKERSLEEAVFR